MDGWLLVRFIHVIAMAFFVGGQLMLAATVVPVARKLPTKEPIQQVARRFGYGTLVAFLFLVATGFAMADHYHLWDARELQIKLGLIVATGLLIGWHASKPEWHAIEGVVFILSLAIVWLGLSLSY